MDPQPMAPVRVLFVTGRLAEQPLRRVVAGLPNSAGIVPEVTILGVSVAAVVGLVLFIVWHNVSLRGLLEQARAEERRSRLWFPARSAAVWEPLR